MRIQSSKARHLFFNSVCFTANILLGVLMTANQSLYNAICIDLNMPVALWIGVLHACVFGGMLLSCLVVGELCEHLGKKKVFVGSAAIMVAGAGLLFLARGIGLCIAGYILMGCGFGVLDGQLNGALVDENPDHPNRIVNFNGAFFSAGAVLSPLLINRYLDAGGNWNAVYLVTMILFAILAFLLSRLHFTFRPTARGKELISIRLLKNPLFLMIGLIIALYCGAEAGASSWTTNYFSVNYDNSLYSGAALSIFWASIGIGRALAGVLGKYKRIIDNISPILSILGLAGMLISPTPFMAFLCYAVSGLGMGPLWGSYFAQGVECAGQNTGAASGMLIFFTSLGGTVIPVGLGLLEGDGVFFASIVLLGIVAVMYYAYTAMQNKRVRAKEQQA